MPTELILIRHGNAVRVNGNYRHAPLTPLGRQQAAQTGQHLRLVHEPLGALYTSTLLRARETAALIAGQVGETPRVEGDIREVELHELAALAILEALSVLDPVEDYLERRAGQRTRWPVLGRVSRVLLDIVANHPDQRVAVVAHHGVILSTLAWFFPAQRFRWWRTQVGNCSLTRLRVEGTRAEIQVIAENRHLSPATATIQLPTRAARAVAHLVHERIGGKARDG